MKKSLYGLKQAPRIWYRHLANFLKDIGYRPLIEDNSVFLNPKTNLIIAVYVDDLQIVGADVNAIRKLKRALSDRFQMTDLDQAATTWV